MAPSDKRVERPRQDRQRQQKKEHGHLTTMQAHLVAASGEFVGTFMFLFFAYATQLMILQQASTTTAPAMDTMYVSLGYGFSLLVTAWAFYRISGGLFNPAVAFGMSLAGELPWMRTAFLIPAQIIACMAAGGVVKAMFPGDMASLNTTLAPGVNIAQGLFAEMFFTSYLVFVVLMLAAEKSKDTFIAPVGIGLALFVAEIPGVYFTGGSLNPARSFGCAVAALSFPGYHWIYWLGPALGAAIAAGYFRFVKMCHYEEANPGQDESEPEDNV